MVGAEKQRTPANIRVSISPPLTSNDILETVI